VTDRDTHRFLLRHDLYEKQSLFYQSTSRWSCFVAGVGSGKTQVGSIKSLAMPPGSRGTIVGPTYGQLRDSTLQTFLELAEPFVDSFNRSTMDMRLKNGSRIHWRSAERPENLRGPNLGWFWLDEAAIMPEYAWDLMIARLRRKPGMAWITTTPKGFDWIWRLFVEKNASNPDYFLVRAATWENPWLPEGFVESLRQKYSGGFARQEIEGEFCEWGRQTVYEFLRARNTEQGIFENQYRRDLPLALSCDFNYLIKPWIVCQELDGLPKVLKCLPVRGGTVQDCVEEFRNWFPDHGGELQIHGDAAGRAHSPQTAVTDYSAMMEAFRGYQAPIRLMVPAKNPPVRDRINNVNRILRGQDGIGPVKIDPDHADWLIQCLLQTQWHPNGKDILKITDPENPESEYSHASDELGYWLFRIYPFRRVALPPSQVKKQPDMDWKTVGDAY
jgi:hypothetical protein